MLYKNNVKKSFNSATINYDSVARIQQQAANQLLNYISISDIKGCGTILDIGAGTGIMSELLFNLFPNALYILNDISEGMLALASSRLKLKGAHYKLLYGDAESIELIQSDLIVSNFVFQWFEDVKASLVRFRNRSSAIAFSLLLDTSFLDWQNLFIQEGYNANMQSYPSYDDLVKFCLALDIGKSFFAKKTYVENYNNPLHFAQHMKALGANSKTKFLPQYVAYKILRNKNAIVANYDVFFGIIQCNQK